MCCKKDELEWDGTLAESVVYWNDKHIIMRAIVLYGTKHFDQLDIGKIPQESDIQRTPSTTFSGVSYSNSLRGFIPFSICSA